MATLNYRELGIRDIGDGIIEFEVLPEHVEQLRGAYIHYTDKAPAGDAALIYCDKSAMIALQVFMKTGKFKAGTFRAEKYSQNWKEYRPKKQKEGAD
jgi:hypothetical protein